MKGRKKERRERGRKGGREGEKKEGRKEKEEGRKQRERIALESKKERENCKKTIAILLHIMIL